MVWPEDNKDEPWRCRRDGDSDSGPWGGGLLDFPHTDGTLVCFLDNKMKHEGSNERNGSGAPCSSRRAALNLKRCQSVPRVVSAYF